ncbi:MAG: RluA family pseudouridine synthase [bacterium]|nr:RluA family pseudouridine synthase [bacterium]
MTDSTQPTFEFSVTEEDAGMRLDAFLVQKCPDISRTKIQSDLGEGLIQVQGRQRPKGFRLKVGWQVTFSPSPVKALEAIAQDLPLNIVYHDEDILILNKAAGMVVHPAVGHPNGTVVNALLFHFKDLTAGDNPLRPGIVHRLDRDTSGLMAVALNDKAHNALAEQLRERVMGRRYQALSWGQWNESEGTLKGDIGRHPRNRIRMAVVETNGRSAVTHYEVTEDFGFAQLCHVKLETGRTHQIRVHFTHFHHPVLGDPTYGDDRRVLGVHPLDRVRAQAMVKNSTRQMLHAWKLDLVHPVTGEEMTFEAELPADMARVLEGLRKETS